MKENIVKRKISENKLVIGSYCNPLDYHHIELLSEVGYDFVVLDTEHGPYFGVEHCVEGVRVAELEGIIPFVRLSHNNPILIQKALDIGAQGVWVPHVDTADECRQVVRASKFPPLGVRGARGVGPREYEAANEQILVTVLPLESKRGINNIDEILSTEGLDMISLSVGDITRALGYPGQPMHPEVVKVRDHVWELCKEKDVAAYAVGSADILQYYKNKGVNVFLSGVNLRKAFQDHMEQLRRILS